MCGPAVATDAECSAGPSLVRREGFRGSGYCSSVSCSTAHGYGNPAIGRVGSVSWNLRKSTLMLPSSASELMSAWRAPQRISTPTAERHPRVAAHRECSPDPLLTTIRHCLSGRAIIASPMGGNPRVAAIRGRGCGDLDLQGQPAICASAVVGIRGVRVDAPRDVTPGGRQ